MFKATIIIISAVGIGGCGNLNRLRTDISAPAPSIDGATLGRQDEALINGLRKAYKKCETDGCAGYELKVKEVPIAEFLQSGITLSDLYCDRFFRNSNRSARDRRFSRSTTNDVGGALNVILGIAKAGSGVSNGVGAGFALGDSFFRNYEDSYMVDADLSKLQRLVHAAQDNMKIKLDNNSPKNIYAAESAILRYANLCSFLGMQSMLNESVEAKTIDIEDQSKKISGSSERGQKDTQAENLPKPDATGTVAAPADPSINAAPPPPPSGNPIP